MNNAKSCLLIDDDYDDQLVFSIIIEKLNKSILCVTADDGLDALKKLEEEPIFSPDVIFLDLNMRGISGIDCLAKIKSNPKLAHIPVVIYTTSSRKQDILTTRSLGAIDYITKSYHITELISKLNDLFSIRTDHKGI